ncbi:NAC domain-containing protein 7-like [Tripterygium wilfordii]|uniref:NAC domain-containing protein 7-like n=1 Tax=Tripterygium wilfordii TaxID=458696 RepID=A0A7J7CEJ5_TRIWF|nr:NAC domain-containing protein 7-like [Tripterygium wilfordii]
MEFGLTQVHHPTFRHREKEVDTEIKEQKLGKFRLHEEGWVVCRAFKKRITTIRKVISEHESPCWYDDQGSLMPDLDSSPPKQNPHPNMAAYHHLPNNYPCKEELDHQQYFQYQVPHHDHFLQLPLLENPKLLHPPSTSTATLTSNISMAAYNYGELDMNQKVSNVQSSISLTEEEHMQQNLQSVFGNERGGADQVTDWRVLDKFVASQLSQDGHDLSKENNVVFQGSADKCSC